MRLNELFDRKYFPYPLLVAISMLLALGCGDGDDGPTDPNGDETFDYAAILTSYTENVVVPTYADQRDKANALVTAIDDLVAGPSKQANLDAVAAAWKDVRVPWEASEAFLFGPAAFLGLDPALDSWPVDRQQLEDVLASSFELTPAFLAEGLGPALRGFHTIEFLVFEDGNARDVSDLSDRERAYLSASAAVLADDSHALWSSWAEGYDGGPAYGDEFKSAGETGSRYLTQSDAILEIVEGMIAICDEVANGKIADPFDEQNTDLVESQFSYNSLTDFTNNMRSVQNAYLGGYHLGTDGPGLNDFVAEQDADLDARLQNEISGAIAAIQDIPEPFRANLDENDKITAAQAAIIAVLNALEEDVKPLIAQ